MLVCAPILFIFKVGEMPNYVEVVTNFKTRGNIIPVKELDAFVLRTTGEVYRSLYLYDESVKKHIEQEGSIALYPGTVYPDRIVLDFDGDIAIQYARSCILQLDDLSINAGYDIYFSGRGFHIELDSRLFNFEPTPNLHNVVKNTINRLFPDADNIFDKPRIYRYRNTINIKSNLYKIPLQTSELQTLTFDQIKDMAKEPRWDFEYNEDVVEPKLSRYIVESVPKEQSVQISQSLQFDAQGRFACINNMFMSKPEHGSRHDIIMRMVSHFKRQNYPKRMVYVILAQWVGEELIAEGRKNELIKVINDIYDSWEGSYTCQDPIMQKFCNSNCPFYKDIDVHDVNRMSQELDRRMQGDLFGFDLKDIWTELGNKYVVEQNELVAINGATGVGKSAFAQNLVLFAGLETLYCSFEMPSYLVHRRNLQILSDSSDTYVRLHYKTLEEKYNKQLKHIKVYTEAFHANELPGIIELIQPKIIVLDHIGLMKSQYRDEFAKISEITQTMRQISLKSDVIIIMINQVSRENAKSGSLNVHSGKGSGSIENDSSKVIAFERKSRTEASAHIHSTKDREGQQLNALFYYNNESLRIGKVLN